MATDFRILGPLEVVRDGGTVRLAGVRQRALLAILLLHAGETVSVDRLMDDLWGERPPEAGVAALRVRVSQLRRALGPDGGLLVTRPPGYALTLAPEQLDLRRFERLVEEGDASLGDDPQTAAGRLRDALALWRGPPLADFGDAAFAQAAIVRLGELRVAALELRIEADLALGHHARLAGELRELVREHPLRERLCGQLMLALYRDGRQAEALEAHRATRRRLVDELGLEPGPALQDLERRILAQDVAPPQPARAPAPVRAILVLTRREEGPDPLVALALSLAAHTGHEVVVASLVGDGGELARRAAALDAVRARAAALGVPARVAVFTSGDPAADAVRLAGDEDVALLLLDAPGELLAPAPAARGTAATLARSPCDVALVAGAERGPVAAGGPTMVAFGGHEHDWAAVELGAWLAGAAGTRLQLLGTAADARTGRRDASRLLGHASIALQRGLGVAADPVLVDPGTDAIVTATGGAAFLVLGLSERFPREGLGEARVAIAAHASAPVVLVRRGLRPGGLAPPRALTRFAWSAG